MTDTVDEVEIIKVIFEGRDKPCSAFGKNYKRVADEDREMTPSELRKMMIAQEYEENWENQSSKGTFLDISRIEGNIFELINAAIEDITECKVLRMAGWSPRRLFLAYYILTIATEKDTSMKYGINPAPFYKLRDTLKKYFQ